MQVDQNIPTGLSKPLLFTIYSKVPKFLDTRNFTVIYLNLKKEAIPWGILSKRCKWNCKQ